MADANIFQQYLRPVKSVAEYDAEADERTMRGLGLESARRKNSMEAAAFDQGQKKQNALQSIAASWTPQTTDEQRIASLRSNPLTFGEADALEKSSLERQKTGAEVSSKAIETARKKLDIAGQAFGFVRDNPTPESAQQVIMYLAQNGVWDQNYAQQALAEIQANPTPEAIRALATQAFQAAVSAKDQLPKTGNANLGGNMAFTATDPLTGRVTTTGTAPITQSADNAASNARMAADAAAGRSVTMRGQDLVNQRSIDAQANKANPKPLPAAALKMQQESLDAIGTASGINADLSAIETQIKDKKLTFGPVSNVISTARNAVGASTEESRNLASFRTNLEKLRNDSLRLNKGVQTDGDAQRAWNELFQNINDTELVKQRLSEIKRLNDRAVQLRKMDIDGVRANYNQEPLDTSAYSQQPASLNRGNKQAPPAATIDSLLEKYK